MSSHSKLIKRGIASLCLSNALQKSCPHVVHDSFHQQVGRQCDAGYPADMLTAVAESLLQRIKKLSTRGSESARRERNKVEVVPYLHGVSHNLKKVAQRHGMKVVFSAPCKLSGL